jgi:hypothetical protein
MKCCCSCHIEVAQDNEGGLDCEGLRNAICMSCSCDTDQFDRVLESMVQKGSIKKTWSSEQECYLYQRVTE